MAGHVPVLDGLRGVAILLVMLVHLTVMESSSLVDGAYYRVAHLGWIGVDLFFVLSGFLITGILYDAKTSPHYFRNFYARRALRIFPLYYAVLFLALLVLPALASDSYSRSLQAAWTYWAFLSNFAVAWHQEFPAGMLIVVWSLAIEEQFYVAWAPLVRWLSYRRLVLLCVTVIVSAFAFRLTLSVFEVHPVAAYVLPFARMDALALGALIAIAVRHQGGLERLARVANMAAPLAGVAAMAITLWEWNPHWSAPMMQTVGYSCLAIMFGSILVVALTAPPHSRIRRILHHPLLGRIGVYSYALYLVHLPLRAVVRDHLFGPGEFPVLWGSQLPGQLMFYVVGSAPAFLLAWVSWHWYERRFLALKKYFPLGSGSERIPPGPVAVSGLASRFN